MTLDFEGAGPQEWPQPEMDDLLGQVRSVEPPFRVFFPPEWEGTARREEMRHHEASGGGGDGGRGRGGGTNNPPALPPPQWACQQINLQEIHPHFNSRVGRARKMSLT